MTLLRGPADSNSGIRGGDHDGTRGVAARRQVQRRAALDAAADVADAEDHGTLGFIHHYHHGRQQQLQKQSQGARQRQGRNITSLFR
jgi:hypothetical protein